MSDDTTIQPTNLDQKDIIINQRDLQIQLLQQQLNAKLESRFEKWWRPLLAYNYALIILWDFFIAPILMPFIYHYLNIAYVPWQPLTLQSGGLFHIAMCSVLGVSAWGRTMEKKADTLANGQ